MTSKPDNDRWLRNHILMWLATMVLVLAFAWAPTVVIALAVVYTAIIFVCVWIMVKEVASSPPDPPSDSPLDASTPDTPT